MVRVTINSLDALYWIFIPLLRQYTFLSKKRLDFGLWSIAVSIIIKGYHLTPNGIKLLHDIRSSMNNRRLTNISQYEKKKCV